MNATEPIRVIIADDYQVVRKGLAIFLDDQEDIQVIGEAQNGNEAVRLCEQLCPDIVLMDLMMPEMDGVTATRTIHERWSQINVLILTSYLEKDLIQEALRVGAVGYLLKNTSGDELVQAIYRAQAGRPTLAPEVIHTLVDAQDTLNKLSTPETEILELLVKGLNNLEISERLGISRSTVAFRIRNILIKLGATNRTEAVVLAIQHNLVV